MIENKNQYPWKMCIRKVKCEIAVTEKKAQNSSSVNTKSVTKNMWGLYAMEDIMAGSFVSEYVGEVITKTAGDIRGTYYDKLSSSCLLINRLTLICFIHLG